MLLRALRTKIWPIKKTAETTTDQALADFRAEFISTRLADLNGRIACAASQMLETDHLVTRRDNERRRAEQEFDRAASQARAFLHRLLTDYASQKTFTPFGAGDYTLIMAILQLLLRNQSPGSRIRLDGDGQTIELTYHVKRGR